MGGRAVPGTLTLKVRLIRISVRWSAVKFEMRNSKFEIPSRRAPAQFWDPSSGSDSDPGQMAASATSAGEFSPPVVTRVINLGARFPNQDVGLRRRHVMARTSSKPCIASRAPFGLIAPA